MGIDALLKRFFPAVVLVLVGIAAFFQASGLGQLVASSVAVDPSSLPTAVAAPRHLPSPAPVNTDHSTSGAAILSRNPFDSATGPLDAKPAPSEDATTPPPSESNGDPMEDPYCDAVKVMLITWSEDPDWSFAAVAGGDGKSTLRRVGDEFNGYKIHYVGWDRIWLMSGAGQRCQVVVGGKPPPPKAGGSAPPSSSPMPEPTTPSSKKKSKVPPEISSKIHKISDTHFEVERSVIDQIMENQADLLRSVRVVPEKDGDKTAGLRLFGIRPDSLLGTLGVENGDRLSSINGFDINDPTKALEAYTKLRSSDHLTVSINRRGKPMNIDVNIK